MAGEPMPPHPPAGGRKPAAGGGIMGWIKAHKGPAAALGAVGLFGVVFLVKSGGLGSGSSSSSNSADASDAADDSSDTGIEDDPGLYGAGSGFEGSFDGGQGQLSQILSELTALQNGAGLPGGPTTGSTGGSTPPTAPPKTPKPTAPKPAPPKTPPKPTTPKKPVSGTPKQPKPQTITVQAGQTLASLSEKYFGTTNRTQLAHLNGLGTGAGLRTGQKLKI